MEQRSEEWFAARLGKVTASRVADILAKTKSGPSASRANYMAELIAERLTGTPGAFFQSPAMAWGTETEGQARSAYEVVQGVLVEEVGFIPHATIDNAGASPDGLVGLDGLVEIKCPNTATHLDTLETQKIPSKYVTQMLWQMECTGRDWCDFVSYDPRLPEKMAIFIKRLERDDEKLREIKEEVLTFLEELHYKIVKLNQMFS